MRNRHAMRLNLLTGMSMTHLPRQMDHRQLFSGVLSDRVIDDLFVVGSQYSLFPLQYDCAAIMHTSACEKPWSTWRSACARLHRLSQLVDDHIVVVRAERVGRLRSWNLHDLLADLRGPRSEPLYRPARRRTDRIRLPPSRVTENSEAPSPP